jgi:hypothetical protein
MANTIGPPSTGLGWDEAAPAVGDAHGNGCLEIQDLRKGLRIRLAKEHITPAANSVGGEHKQGSAVFWIQDAEPTTRPDGVTALTNADLGRIWVDTVNNVAKVLTAIGTSNTWTPIGELLLGIYTAGNEPSRGLYMKDSKLFFKGTDESAVHNYVTNGGFTSDLTGWSGANWAYSSGTALHTAGATTALSQAAATVTSGRSYTLTFSVVGGSAGTVTPSVGGITLTARSYGSVTYTETFTATATTALAFTPSSTFDGAIDGVRLVEYGAFPERQIAGLIDEDDLGSDSDVLVASEQAVKAYIDSGTVPMKGKVIQESTIRDPTLMGNVNSGTDNHVTNGAFTSNIAGWSGDHWEWSGGTALHTAGETEALSQATATVVNGRSYTLTFSVVGGTVGTVTPSCGGVTLTARNYGSATYTETFTATATTALAFTPSSTFNGAIDTVSLVPYGSTTSLVLDEDDMSSNSAVKLATQQSIKAYVDTTVADTIPQVTKSTTAIKIEHDGGLVEQIFQITSTSDGDEDFTFPEEFDTACVAVFFSHPISTIEDVDTEGFTINRADGLTGTITMYVKAYGY